LRWGRPKPGQSFLEDIVDQPGVFEAYKRLVFEELSDLEMIEIASVVSAGYVFDFAILHESLLESWNFYPFRLHAYALDDEANSTLVAAGLDGVEVHRAGSSNDWWQNVAQKIALVGRSGLDRCLVSDVDNVFVQETPELFLLLDRFDFVFIGSPHPDWPIQGNIWGFRSNERTRRFAEEWAGHASTRRHSEASGLPFALLDRDPDLRVKVLARPPDPSADHNWAPAPYDVQVNYDLVVRSDALGYWHPQVGRAKVVHLGALRAEGNESVAARIETVVARYPDSADFLPHYVTLANRAGGKLGLPTLADPVAQLKAELDRQHGARTADPGHM
jgi:hypothetical protein